MIEILPESPPVPEGCEDKVDLVLSSLTRHLALMGLDHWNIKIQWVSVDEKFVMETEVQPEYYKATISIDLPELKLPYLNEYIRHECFHIILWQYTETAETLAPTKKSKAVIRKLEERTVSDLERMPLWDKIPSALPNEVLPSSI